MTTAEIAGKAAEWRELKRMKAEVEAEIATVEQAIKEEMGDREELVAGSFKILWKPYCSNHLDIPALKKECPDIAARFTRPTSIRRFTVA